MLPAAPSAGGPRGDRGHGQAALRLLQRKQARAAPFGAGKSEGTPTSESRRSGCGSSRNCGEAIGRRGNSSRDQRRGWPGNWVAFQARPSPGRTAACPSQYWAGWTPRCHSGGLVQHFALSVRKLPLRSPQELIDVLRANVTGDRRPRSLSEFHSDRAPDWSPETGVRSSF